MGLNYDDLKKGDIVNGVEIICSIFGKKTIIEYDVRCIVDGFEFRIKKNALKKGTGCKVCSGRKIIKGVNDLETRAPEIVKFLKNKEDAYKYGVGSHSYVDCKCPKCGYEKKVVVYSLYERKDIGCICGDHTSYPTKIMLDVLNQLNVDFITEYSPEWIRPKRYDFYIPSKNLIIEMDGGLGHGRRVFNESKFSSLDSLLKDIYKDNYAFERGLGVIRIDAEKSEIEYIKNNILRSELNDIFNLDCIDWKRTELFALKEKVIKCCCLWNEGMTNTSEIAGTVNIHYATVVDYLKIGARLELCDYDPDVVRANNAKMIGMNNLNNDRCKPVSVYKKGEYIGSFKSSYEIARLSIDLFGMKLLPSHIREVCNGIRKSHKGMVFKYD